jgi:sphingolipid delta-4 desaturase
MAVTALHIYMAYVVRDMSWWAVIALAYMVGGTCSQNLFTAQHELSHFLAFRKPLYNKILSFVSNMPLVVPMATAFRKYHQEHHSHLVSHHSPNVACPVGNARQLMGLVRV